MRALFHRLFLKFLLFCRHLINWCERRIHVFLVWLHSHLKRLKPIHITAAVISGLAVFTLLYGGQFFWPRTLNLAYDKPTCFFNPLFLPRLAGQSANKAYNVQPVTSLSIAGYPIYSQSTCVKPVSAPAEHSNQTLRFGTGWLSKRITVKVGAFPTLDSQTTLDGPIPTQDPLLVSLSSGDQVFNYQLAANQKTVACTEKGKKLSCDVSQLGLTQSATYTFKLQRFFRETPLDIVLEKPLTTVESVHIVTSSIGRDQTIYDTRNEFTISLNRPVISMDGTKFYLIDGDKRQEVAATFSLSNQTIAVKTQQPLPRSASFLINIDRISAADGGYLVTPYSLPFKTSGGPRVTNVSIPHFKVAPASAITLNFDTAVAPTDIKNFVRLEANGNSVAASVTARGNSVTLQPEAPLPRCASLTVKVLDGLQNSYGISGGSAWQYRSRVTCQAVFSIGTSVQGRGITAYSFGNGPSKMIFVGGTHGDEKSSVYLLNRWIDELEASGSIPAQRTIIIIPNLNPDGFAMGRRTNANNVDLNRNFPSNNWKSAVTMPDKSFSPNGGGTTALSEPESRALAGYILAQGPRLVLTYHAVAGVVIPNDAGDSVALARQYDQKSNVGFLNNGSTGSIFHYDTTGAMEDWLQNKPGIAGLLVELWTMSDNEFGKHQPAMWSMIQIP